MIVYLHIGTPKSGSSYLQAVLGGNRATLASNGVLWPGREWGDQVRAVQDVLGIFLNGAHPPQVEGSWERLVREITGWGGRAAVLSMEWLVRADPAQARQIVESLRPHEVRVVVTARDLGRNVPAQWQEQVKNWAVWAWDDYLTAVTSEDRWARGPARQFWTDHDLHRIIGTWAGALSVERIAVVTVPGRGAPPDLLWRRFAEVIGVDADACDPAVRSGNASLGAASAELLRRVNIATRERGLDWRYGDRVVKWALAKGVLVHRRALEAPLLLPSAHRDWAIRESRRLIAAVEASGVAVHGSTEELLPSDEAFGDPSAPGAEDLLDAALDGLTGLVMELARRVEVEMAPPPPTRLQRVVRSKPFRPVAIVGLPVRGVLRRVRGRG